MWLRASMVTIATVALTIVPGSATAERGLEAQMAQQVSSFRASSGLGPLHLDVSLSAGARNWSSQMASSGSLSHSAFTGSGPERRGENVGMGASIDEVHAALVASPTHAANLLDPEFTNVGIGVVVAGDGTVFVTQQFLRPSEPATGAAPETLEDTDAVEAPAESPEAEDAPAENPPPATPGGDEAPSPVPAAAPASSDPAPEPSDRLKVNLQLLRRLDG